MKLACLDYSDREYCQLAVEKARAQSRRERETSADRERC